MKLQLQWNCYFNMLFVLRTYYKVGSNWLCMLKNMSFHKLFIDCCMVGIDVKPLLI